jgi:hypothetical protein
MMNIFGAENPNLEATYPSFLLKPSKNVRSLNQSKQQQQRDRQMRKK